MATATFTEVVDKATGDTITESNWDDMLRDNINQLAGGHKSLLVNGSFNQWQRGAGAFASNNFWSADRWYAQRQGAGTSSQSVTQETSTTDGNANALKTVVTSYVTVATEVVQKLEDYVSLRSQTISFSIRVNQSVASCVTPFIRESLTTTTSGSTSATTGSFVTLTVTATIGGSATAVECGVAIAANATVYLTKAMLVLGPAPAPYRPLHPQEDLARCQRYYEVHGGQSGTTGTVWGYAAAGSQNFGATIYFAVPKYGTPTVTKNGTWGVVNCGQPSVINISSQCYSLQATSSAAGLVAFERNSSDDTITAESNP